MCSAPMHTRASVLACGGCYSLCVLVPFTHRGMLFAWLLLKQHVLIRRVLGLRTEQSRFRPCPHIGTARDRSAEPACFSLPHSSALTDCSRARSYTNCFRLACDRTIRRRLAFAAAQLSPHGCGHEFSLVLCLTRLLPHRGAPAWFSLPQGSALAGCSHVLIMLCGTHATAPRRLPAH